MNYELIKTYLTNASQKSMHFDLLKHKEIKEDGMCFTFYNICKVALRNIVEKWLKKF